MSDESDKSPDFRLLDQRVKQAVERAMEKFRGGSGGGGSHDGTIDGRVGHLEAQMSEVLKRLDRIETKLDSKASAVDVAEIKGRVAQIPNLVQVAGLVFAIFAAAFVLLRFALPH